MKKLLSVIAIVALTLSVTAQENRSKMPNKEGMHQGKHKGGKHHNRQMMKELNFSDAQKNQLKANRESYKAKMHALKQEQNITVKEYNARKEALNREQKAFMQSVLTPEQKTKMAELKQKKENEHLARSNKRFDKMKTDLSLTNEQAAKLKAQQESVHNNLKAIRENESLSKDQKKEQMRAIKETAKEQRKQVLTADQLKKMDDLKKDKHPKDRNRQNNK